MVSEIISRRAVSAVKITYSIHLPSDVASVPVARSMCRANLALVKVEQQSIDDVALALTEACTNAVLHAAARSYVVDVVVDGDLCQIDVCDEGRGMKDRAAANSEREGGRGLDLMETLVDTLNFRQREKRGTLVSFSKQLRLMTDSPLLALTLDPSDAS